MCEPVTIGALSMTAAQTAMAGFMAASAAATMYGQNQQAKATVKASGIQAQNQAEEQRAAAEVELGTRVRERNARIGTAVTAAGEAGVSGQSYALTLNNIAADFERDQGTITKNLGFQQRATQGQLDSVRAARGGPTALSAGLNIAGAAMKGYNIAAPKGP